MNLVPRVTNNRLEIFNADDGLLKKTLSLPSDANYGSPIVSGDTVTIGIQFNNGRNISRVYNIKTGSLVREISM